MNERNANILEVLGVADREDAITNLLCFCFRRSRVFRRAFLERVCGVDAPIDGWVARTRIAVRGHGTPDLALGRPGEPGTLVIIENKLKAGEGQDQTRRYAADACIRTGPINAG